MEEIKGSYNFKLTGEIERKVRYYAKKDHRPKHSEVLVLIEEAIRQRENIHEGAK